MKSEQQKEQMLGYYAKRKQELIDYLGGACLVCGATESLEFDHIRWQDKSFTIGQNWGMKDREALYAELDKCQLLCKDHHREKTLADLSEIGFQQGITHGTYYAFQRKKCVCEVCELAKREWYDKRNAKRRDAEGPRGPYNQPAEHGTYKRYKRGCKCDLCRAANTAHAREQRQRKATS